jgi:hypothetical protein
MKYLGKYVNNVLLLSFVLISSLSLISSPVFADTPTNSAANTSNNQTNSSIPLEITPQCSDAASSSAYWQVNNKNSSDVNVSWTNIDNGHTGSFTAIPGLSQLVTYFDDTDPNNTTQFSSLGNTTQTNATEAACAPTAAPTQPTPPACVDGSIQQNLSIDWVSPSEVTVQTVNDAPLCNDITIDFSSYVMPADYNGQGFYTNYDPSNPSNNVVNPTAYPQTIFDNQSASLGAGTDGLITLKVNLPNSCNNIQVDVYYAPVQTVIGAQGSGTANIASQVYTSTSSCSPCPPVTTNPGGNGGSISPTTTSAGSTSQGGGKGAGGPLPVTAVTTSSSSSPVSHELTNSPTVLAYTGESPVVPYLIAIALLGMTSTLVYAVRKDNI